MPIELFDVLDCTGRKTGKTIPRDEAHRAGTWHGAFHCLIIYQRDGRNYALFQLRAAQKLIAPGKFDVSVGGHYTTGENAEIAGPREMKEELGFEVKFDKLLPLGRRVFVYCFSPGVTEYEFQDVFLLPATEEPKSMVLQADEVAAVLEMDVDAGIKLFSGELKRAEGRLFKTEMKAERAHVSTEDFVPCLDNYYLKLLQLAQRYFNGERKLLVI
jgi:isopentenyldiphosphate isomerase